MKKIIIIIFCLLIVILASCNKNKNYHATFVRDGYAFDDEYIFSHNTYGACSDETTYLDENIPKEIYVIIDNDQKLNEVFNSFPSVDFEKEMILLYAFTTTNNTNYYIDSVNYHSSILEINYGQKKQYGRKKPNALPPYTRWLIVKMDIIEVEDLQFNYIGYVRWWVK